METGERAKKQERNCRFSLPMRDGNLSRARTPACSKEGFSLPMRDGNRSALGTIHWHSRVLAYL